MRSDGGRVGAAREAAAAAAAAAGGRNAEVEMERIR